MKIKRENPFFTPVTITLETPQELLFITKVLGSLTSTGKEKLGIETARQFNTLKDIIEENDLEENYRALGEYMKLVVNT